MRTKLTAAAAALLLLTAAACGDDDEPTEVPTPTTAEAAATTTTAEPVTTTTTTTVAPPSTEEPADLPDADESGVSELEDGNHRVEALRRAGVGRTWTIIGFDDPDARDRFIARSEQTRLP